MKDWKLLLYKNQQLIIYTIIAVFILSVDYKLFFISAAKDLIKTIPQVAQLKRKLNTAKNAASNISKYQAQIKELNTKLFAYHKKFSTSEQKTSLLEELSTVAKETMVKIVTVKPLLATTTKTQSTDVSTSYHKFSIMIRASCGYHQLGLFINRLENAATFMRVANIKITADPQNPLEHNVDLVVNTYILDENL